ncbi:hypothetical protein HA402_014711 [Bradysia odoriphaga]|nr:hypothetical protein HA402_014711 [Bradysia odoriphaga]
MRSLDGTIFSWVYDVAWSNCDEDLFDKISAAMTVFVLGSFALNFFGPVRYGKSAGPISKHPNFLNYKLTSKFVWRYGFIATILVPLLMAFVTPCSKIGNFCNAAGLTIHCLHYFNRTIIYPSKISPKATPQTLWFFLLMVLITTLHGFIQSHHLLNVHTASVTYVTYLGILFYIVGASINSYHDNLLINLRNTSTIAGGSDSSFNYKIPTGGIFEYVSCANYFGELMEWWGFFMVTKGYPQFLFAIFATAFLGCRARFAHKFYKDKFGSEYPDHRKALIPFIY